MEANNIVHPIRIQVIKVNEDDDQAHANQEDQDLWHAKQVHMFDVFNMCLLTDIGKTFEGTDG